MGSVGRVRRSAFPARTVAAVSGALIVVGCRWRCRWRCSSRRRRSRSPCWSRSRARARHVHRQRQRRIARAARQRVAARAGPAGCVQVQPVPVIPGRRQARRAACRSRSPCRSLVHCPPVRDRQRVGRTRFALRERAGMRLRDRQIGGRRGPVKPARKVATTTPQRHSPPASLRRDGPAGQCRSSVAAWCRVPLAPAPGSRSRCLPSRSSLLTRR